MIRQLLDGSDDKAITKLVHYWDANTSYCILFLVEFWYNLEFPICVSSNPKQSHGPGKTLNMEQDQKEWIAKGRCQTFKLKTPEFRNLKLPTPQALNPKP